jgi:hypothetical protein
MSAAFNALEIYCAQNANGGLCGIELLNAANTFAPAEVACTADAQANVCNSGCQRAAQTLINQMGCCFRTFVTAEKDWGDVNKPDSLANIEVFMRTKCGVTAPPACRPAGRIIAARIVLRNILFTWYVIAVNKAQLEAAILRDIAIYLGCRENQISYSGQGTEVAPTPAGQAVGVMAEGGVAFNIQVTSDAGLDDVQTQSDQFDQGIKAGGVSLLATSQLGVASRSDPTNGVVIDPSSSSSSTAPLPNSAAGLSASLFAMLVAMIAALLL